MASKRGNGEGSFRQRPDGRWEGRLTYPDPATGASKRLSVYGATRAEAAAKLKDKRARTDAGRPVQDSRDSLAAFAERWATTTLEASDRKASTKATYRTVVARRIVPSTLGAMRLDKVRPTDVEAFLLDLTRAGMRPATQRQTFAVVRAILDAAKRDRLVAENVADDVDRPRSEHTEARHLDPAEVERLLGALAGGRFEAVARVMVGTGLRRGEALALRWEDMDLDAGRLIVRGTLGRVGGALVVSEPKSKRSRRVVGLPPYLVAVLKRHRASQAADRLSAGAEWQDSGLVFTSRSGGPVEPRNLLRAIQDASRKAGLDDVKAHTLRHSAASLMLMAGVPLLTVSRRLGHSSTTITGDIYGHVGVEDDAAAGDALAQRLGWA